METMASLATLPGADPILAPEKAARRGRILVLAGMAGLLGLYLVGLDKGLLISLLQDRVALDPMLIHELVHDARHLAAFPCH